MEKIKTIDPKKLANLSKTVGKKEAKKIHMEIMRAILCSYNTQSPNKNGNLIIPVSKNTAQILE